MPILKKSLIIFSLLFLLLFSASKLKYASTQLELESYDTTVEVEIVELPLCGRSNIIIVEYNNNQYRIPVSKNDCIKGEYKIGKTIKATYNSKLNKMNPLNFKGIYRLWMIAVGVLSISLVSYILYLKKS